MEIQKKNSDKAKELNEEFEKLKMSFPDKLSRDYINSFDLSDIEKNNINAIYNSIQIRYIPTRLLRFKISQIVNNILIQTERKPENQHLLYDLIAQDVQMNFKYFGIEEIYYAMYYGIRSQYGEVYHFDCVTVYKWINFYKITNRNHLIKIIHKNIKTEKPINKEMMHFKWLKHKINEINHYIENDIRYSIKDINNLFFKYAVEKGLITEEFIKKAMLNIEKIKKSFAQEYEPSLINLDNFEERTKKLLLYDWIRLRKKENKPLDFDKL